MKTKVLGSDKEVVMVSKEEILKNQVATITETAGKLVITDKPSFDGAGEYLIKLATLKKTVTKYFKPLKEATHKAHKAVTQKEKDELTPIDMADRIVRVLRGDYKRKEDAKIQKEQDRLDKIAKTKADKAAEKLLAKAEKEEDPEKKEELEQKAEDVYVAPNIAAGTMDKTTKQEGGGSTTFIKDIEIEVEDFQLFLKEIAEGNVPYTVFEFKPGKIKSWVKAMDIKNGQIKGLRITETERESVRAR